MRRFYCTVCKKMKRVQKWPRVITSVNSTNPIDRIGECNYHAVGSLAVYRELTRPTPKVVAPIKAKKVS